MKLLLINLFLMVASLPATAQQNSKKEVVTFLSSDHVPIAYEVLGNGKTSLVFIHGWSCDRSYWKEQLPFFAKEYKVVAIDLGGHGASGLGRKDWSINSFGNDVAAVVKGLGLQRIILIGHSMGGDVIADAARQLCGYVIGLVMVDTYKKLNAGRTPESVKAFVSKFKSNFADSVRPLIRSLFLPNSDSSLVDFVTMDMSSAPPDVALSALESSFHHSREITKDLAELNLPVVALNPDNDLTDIASMHQHKVEVVIMPGVGHFLMMEDAKRFNELLKIVVQKLAKQGHRRG